jgi:hypothetical protein
MADGFTVEASNAAGWDAMLRDIRGDLDHLADPTSTAATELVNAASPAAPRRTGRLAGAGHVTRNGGNGARITVDTPYAAPVHWGWPGHGISRQPWLVATWLREARPLDKMTDAVQANIDKAAERTR